MSQSAPIGAYTQLCPKTKTTTEEQRTLLALPLTEYKSNASQTPSDALNTFKNKFFIDEVVIFTNVGKATPDATTFTKGGIMAFVKPGGPNAQHHNLSTTSPSRLSKLRIKKKVDNVETEYQALNDGGLNTTPDVKLNLAVAYSNCLVFTNITVTSAYYLNTQQGDVTHNLKINTVDVHGYDFTPFPYIPKRGNISRDLCTIFGIQGNPEGGDVVSFSITATNSEGSFTAVVTTDMKREVAWALNGLEPKIFRFTSTLPSQVTSDFFNSLPESQIYMYKVDLDKVNTSNLPSDLSGGSVAPNPPPEGRFLYAYKNMFMDNPVVNTQGEVQQPVLASQGWYCDFRNVPTTTGSRITFFHVNDGGAFNCYYNVEYVSTAKGVILSIENHIIQPGEQIPGWHQFDITLTRNQYDQEPPYTQVTVQWQAGCHKTDSPQYVNNVIVSLQEPDPETGTVPNPQFQISSNLVLSTGIKGPVHKTVYVKNMNNFNVYFSVAKHQTQTLPPVTPESYDYYVTPEAEQGILISHS